MAIQWADSFSRYGTGSASTTAMRDGLPYNNWISTCVTDPDPLAVGERACLINTGLFNNPLGENRIALPSFVTGVVAICSRYWFNAFGSGNNRRCVAVFTDNTPTAIASVIVESNGAISLYNGLTGSQIDTTGSPVISTNSWNHIESTYSAVTGAMEVRLNGVTILTGTATASTDVYFAFPLDRIDAGSGGGMYIKDFVIWDDTGTENDDFLGSVVVRRYAPDADVTLGGWVPSTGTTGFNLLNKSAVNDATYLSADDTPPAAMQFDIENLPDDVTSIKGVVTVVRARKIDGGDATLQASLLSGGDTDPGADRPITTAFTYFYDVSELDPDTAAPWTPAAFDLVEAEIDRTT